MKWCSAGSELFSWGASLAISTDLCASNSIAKIVGKQNHPASDSRVDFIVSEGHPSVTEKSGQTRLAKNVAALDSVGYTSN